MASSSHVSPSDAAADTGSHSEAAQKDSPVSLLQDVLNKVEASLMVNVETHTQSQEYSYRKDGLDFLDTKNSLLLSYMIDLVYRQRSKLMRLSTDDSEMEADEATAADEDSNYQRLLEMKTILDKSSGLDRKLRYQLDKILLQASSHRSDAGAFATQQSNDPLQFRPAMALDDENDAGSSSDDDHDDDEGDKSHDVDDDDDLAAARQTMFLARQKKGAAKNAEVGDDAVYRAPRLVAAPYPMDHSAGEEALSRRMERSEQRLRQKLRASEMVQTMKQQLGDRDQPDQEDTTGGTAMGTQSDASRRFLQQQKERTKYEEEFMIRFTTTKQEKKEQRRLMREEQSNLSSLSDLNNLVRDSSLLHRQGEQKKRKTDDTPRTPKRSTPKNALQAELFGGASGESRRKKKSHR